MFRSSGLRFDLTRAYRISYLTLISLLSIGSLRLFTMAYRGIAENMTGKMPSQLLEECALSSPNNIVPGWTPTNMPQDLPCGNWMSNV